MYVLKRIAWLVLRVVFGLTSLAGAVLAGWGAGALLVLLSGRAPLYFDEPPPIAAMITVLVVGLVMLIGGYKAPAWLKLDRLL